MKFRAIPMVAIVLVAAATVRADDPLESRWRPDNLRIDGVMSDWPVQTFVSKEVAASVVNDGQDVYILVATSDSAVNRQLQRAGLAVYLDPKGGKSEAFGIRIPPIGDRLSPGIAPAGPQDDAPILTYFDVLGPEDDERRNVELTEKTGIDLRIGTNDGTFFLELKVPMLTGAGRPYAPGISLQKGSIGLGIVTPDPLRTPRGRGGRGRLGGGGGPPPDRGKEVEIWTKVQLAQQAKLIDR